MKILIFVFIILALYEIRKKDEKISELSAEKRKIKNENDLLKFGRCFINIGEKNYLLSEYERSRYENWRDFYYKKDYLFGYNIALDNETFYDTIILGILDNKSNEDILNELKYKESIK